MNEFDGGKLRVARTYRGWNQQELAERAALTQGFVSMLEKGARAPGEDVLSAVSHAVGFDREFFLEPADDLFDESACYFRRRRRTLVGVRQRLVACGNIFNLVVDYLERALRLPKNQIPQLSAASDDEIEVAAKRCRVAWGLGVDLPCTNVLRAVERHGAVSTRFEVDALDVDAFSRAGSRPIIVLNSDKGSATRARFDVAHELGHLVLHHHIGPGAETEADRFASAFLLPREGFGREFPLTRRVEWTAVFRLKARWKVSAAAIVRRAYDLRRIDSAEYRRAFKTMSYRGWLRGGEPEEPDGERPETVELAFKLLQERYHEDVNTVGRRLGVSTAVLRSVGVAVEASPPVAGTSKPRGTVLPFRPRADR